MITAYFYTKSNVQLLDLVLIETTGNISLNYKFKMFDIFLLNLKKCSLCYSDKSVSDIGQ